MQDDASLKNDATPSLDDASARPLPDHEMKTRGRDWMVFPPIFAAQLREGSLGFPLPKPWGL